METIWAQLLQNENIENRVNHINIANENVTNVIKYNGKANQLTPERLKRQLTISEIRKGQLTISKIRIFCEFLRNCL